MSNFFLLNEAIDIEDTDILQDGISELIVIEQKKEDRFQKHDSLYELPVFMLLCSFAGLQGVAIIKFIEQLENSEENFKNEKEFDHVYPEDCNSFLGIDFSKTKIQHQRQVINNNSYLKFKEECDNREIITENVGDFWNKKHTLFKELVFCDRVWDQISHLSINDDRFKNLNSKLKVLNDFTKKWESGPFVYQNLGLDNSPDTPQRIASTRDLRTFNCPEIGERVFSLHIKWYYGGQAFRLYYFPCPENYKVYIGYIGPKDDIGF